MLYHHILLAFRNLGKHRMHSFINLGGLAIGMAVTLLIGLWMHGELSFNQEFQNYDRIAEVKANASYDGQVYTVDSHPLPLAQELRTVYGKDFAVVVAATAMQEHVLASGDKQFAPQGRYMEAGAPDMLSLSMTEGLRSALGDPHTVLLSATLAQKLFGGEDPLGRTLRLDKGEQVRVGGVYGDLPANSDFRGLDFIAPFDLYLSTHDPAELGASNWSKQWTQVYVQLIPGADPAKVSTHIRDVSLRHLSGAKAARKPQLFLHPMSRWHLYSAFANGVTVTSEPLKLLWLYGVIGSLVLLLACINFMNLSTARSERRAKEVGIRKTIGSGRGQLIGQFFSESILTAVCAAALSLILVQFMLPWFSGVAGRPVTIAWSKPLFWIALVSFTLATGVLSGLYPALYLSHFRPVKVLKGTFHAGRRDSTPRRALVVLQFTLSIALAIGTLVVYRQVRFAEARPAGYDRRSLLSFQAESSSLEGQMDRIASELEATGAVAGVAASSSPLTSIWSTSTDYDWTGKAPGVRDELATIGVTQGYGKTVGWTVKEGRDFSASYAGDARGIVLNEAAVRLMGLRHPVGMLVKHDGKVYTVLGVVGDMVMESPFQQTPPSVYLPTEALYAVFLRVNSSVSIQDALARIEGTLRRLFPGAPLDLRFADEAYDAKFSAEEHLRNMVSSFAALTLVISCLGLFGLAAFMAEQRTKEIGVRKVLGASAWSLWGLLAGDFLKLVLLAFVVAVPLSYYFMQHWLGQYTYRTTLSWWIFGCAGTGAVVLSLFTVSTQAIRAAWARPINSLRTE